LLCVTVGIQTACCQTVAQLPAPPNSQLTPQQKAALNHVMFRSPQLSAFISRAREAIRQDDLRNGLIMLQQVLGDPRGAIDVSAGAPAPPDSFAWSEYGPKSQRREVLEVFESLSGEQLQVYERMYGAVANEALQQAQASGNLVQLQEIVRRCWPTAAGALAVDRLATRLLDQGQPESAARLWSSLADSRVHRHRVSEAIFEKAAVAHLLAGDTQAAEAALQQLERRFGVRPNSLAALERELTARAPRINGGDADWSTPYGGLKHNSLSPGTTPWLEPEWSASLGGTSPFEMLDIWANGLIASEVERFGATVSPIVVNDLIVLRDLDGIRACDSRSGRIVWRFNGTLSVPQLAAKILGTRYRTSHKSIVELAWTGNPAISMLSSDGERVFAVDWTEFSAAAPAIQTRAQRYSGPTIEAANRLVCLPSSGAEVTDQATTGEPIRVEPLWTIGGSPAPTADDRLGGHLFVGPPMAFGDSVFAIVESVRDKELKLVRVDSLTGQIQWMQTLGIIEQPMFASSQRFRRTPSCIPAIARGIAVCPTDAGFLVGVDTVSGELLWLQTYFEMRLPSRFGSTVLREADDVYIGFADPPHIDQDRVVYLPRHSEELHCYDLRTGQELWHVPRGNDQYVAAIHRGVVAVAGKSGVRGVSLQDGSQLWQQRTGVPSGRGVLTEDGYLLPLKTGGIARIDLQTGTEQGSGVIPTLLKRRFAHSQSASDGTRPRPSQIAMDRFGLLDESIAPELRPGNLLLHDHRVFSVGPQTLTAFPQAGSLLLDLHGRRSSTQPVDLFQLASVELLMGNQKEGESLLTDLSRTPGHPQQLEARWMLRNLILADLRHPESNLSTVEFRNRVNQFEALIDSPFDEQQLLFERIRWERKNGNQAALLQTVALLPGLQLRSFLPQDNGFESVVSSTSLSRSLIRDTLDSSPANAPNPLRDAMNSSLLDALRTDSKADLERFIQLYGDTPYAARIRNRLADLLIQSGDAQAAELVLLPNLQSDNHEHRAVSQVLYITLLTLARFDSEAGRALQNYLEESRGVSISTLRADSLKSPQTVLTSASSFASLSAPKFEDFVAAFDRNLQPWSVYLDLQPAGRPIRQVAIRRLPWSEADPETIQRWSQTPRQIAGPSEIEFQILHSGSYVAGKWTLMDRYTGTERGTIRIPTRPNFANAASYRSVGHLMPVGGQSSLMGVSLLDYLNQGPLWHFSFPPTETAAESLEPGPSTPTVCVFQTRKHLIGVAPADGSVLWRRSDLDLESGVFVDREAGLLGDDRVIVMFHRDQQSYTRLDALTGAILNSASLPVNFRYGKRVFGRKLFHISTPDINAQQFARVWDPLTETYDLEEPFAGGRLHGASEADELALASPGGRLQVFQMPEATKIADTQIGPSALETSSSMQFFSDKQRFYVNLSRPGARPTTSRPRHYPVTDSLPAQPTEPGLLIAIDRKSGRVLWRREVTHKSLLKLQNCNLPFFVAVSRVQLTRQVGTVQTLDIEIIDRQTGETLGHRNDLLSDRLVHYRLDREHGTLQLHGLNSRIDLDFHVPPQGILLEQQPR
jgi:outer membrane protein assembly factor BamB